MSSPLDNLAATDALRREPPDAREYEGLVHSGRVRPADAQKPGLALESRFDLAYNALCLAALRRHGFRATNRYVVFQALPHTLGLGPEVWSVLAKCHRVRNEGEYEGNLNLGERLVVDLIAACRAVDAALAKLPAPT